MTIIQFARSNTLPSAQKSSTARLFWLFLILHALLWTIIPTLCCPNAPLDVIENYMWGQEWVMGTHKHPPMQAWCLELLALLTGHASWSYFMASQIAICTAFWAVWETAKRLVGETQALISVVLLEGIAYYNFTSHEFNANLLQIPFWALMGMSFYKAIVDNKMKDWVLLGVWSAGGLYSKYSTLLFLGTLCLVLVSNKESHKRLKEIGPYISLIIMSTLFAPHFSWLVANDFLPLAYSMNRVETPDPHHEEYMKHIVFVGAQLLALLPMLIWYFTACKQESVTIIPPTKRSFDSAFLKGVVLGPIGIVILLLIATDFHVRDMWATPFWSFAGLALIYFFPRTLAPSTLKRFSYGLLTVALFGIIGFVGNTALGPYFSTKPQRVHFPGQQIALQINNAWHQRYKTPLSFVIGDIWSAGNVSYYTSDRPHVFIDSNKVISPWINTDEVAKKGAVIVWCEQGCNSQNDKQPDYVATQYPNAEMQEPIVLSRQTKAPASEVKIGWALLPPTAQ